MIWIWTIVVYLICKTNQHWTVVLIPPPNTGASCRYQSWAGTKTPTNKSTISTVPLYNKTVSRLGTLFAADYVHLVKCLCPFTLNSVVLKLHEGMRAIMRTGWEGVNGPTVWVSRLSACVTANAFSHPLTHSSENTPDHPFLRDAFLGDALERLRFLKREADISAGWPDVWKTAALESSLPARSSNVEPRRSLLVWHQGCSLLLWRRRGRGRIMRESTHQKHCAH